MNAKQPPLEIARAAEQATVEPPRVDAGGAKARQTLEAEDATPEPLALSPYKFSRIEISPQLRNAASYEQLSPSRSFTSAARAASLARECSGRANPPNPPLLLPPKAGPEPDPVLAKPKTWPGVVIACLLGAMPIIALVLVRWQSNGPEDPLPPIGVIETAPPPTGAVDISAPASLAAKPAMVEPEPEPEVVDALLEPGVAPAAAAQVAHTKSTAGMADSTRPSADRVLASKPSSRPNPGPCLPAPVRSSWFHR